MMNNGEKVSVIICVYTMERLQDIREAVGSVLAQTLKPHEVIVAVDHNKELFHKLQSELSPQVKLVLNEGPRGLSETRNVGVRSSTGEIVAFIDDDAMADRSWLEDLTKHFSDPLVAAVGGTVMPQWLNGKRLRWFLEELDWVVGCTYKGLPLNGNRVRNVLGCNMAFKTGVVKQVGFFSTEVGRFGKTQGVGEEAEICLRIKHEMPEAQILHEHRAVTYHKVPAWRLSLRYSAQRSYNEGLYKRLVKDFSPDSSLKPLSTEYSYLRHLLFAAIPQGLRRFYKPWALAQVGAIMISMAATGIGYLAGKVAPKQALGMQHHAH